MSEPHGFHQIDGDVTVTGEAAGPLATAMHMVLNEFAETVMQVDPAFERNALVVAVPGKAITGRGPAYRATHWMGKGDSVVAGPVPGWLGFQALVDHRDADAEWDHICFFLGAVIDRTPGIELKIATGRAGRGLAALLEDQETGAALLDRLRG